MDLGLTKKGTPRKRKPKQKIYYFTKDTEEAILEYVNSTDQRFRDKIYRERIDFAFFKLTQNIINTFKFDYVEGSIEDIQQEVIYFLLTKLSKYTQEKGAAYSYFGTIAKRYLIIENEKMYKKIKNRNEIDDEDEKTQIIDEDELLSSDNYDLNDDNYSLNMFLKYLNLHAEKIFTNENELNICYSIIHLFERRENIEIFNKKAILLYLRELTKQDTQNITKVSKKIKIIYNRLHNQYLEYGFISLNF